MPESELRTKVAIVVSHDNETDEGGVWLKGEKPIELTGPRFSLLILVDEGVVKRVSLLRIARMGKANCKASFDAMVNAVAAQHGSPDARESPGISGGEDSYRAFFRFADGAFIEVNSDRSAEGDACFDSIVHFAPTPDDLG